MSSRILLQPHTFKDSVIIDSSLSLNGSFNLNGESVSATLNSKATLNKNVNSISGSSYSLLVSDNDKIIKHDSSSDTTITIPLNLFPVGSQITFVQYGFGQIIISPESGVACYSLNEGLKSAGRYAKITLLQVDLNSWILSGDIAV